METPGTIFLVILLFVFWMGSYCLVHRSIISTLESELNEDLVAYMYQPNPFLRIGLLLSIVLSGSLGIYKSYSLRIYCRINLTLHFFALAATYAASHLPL